MSFYLDLTAKAAFLEKRIKEKETFDTLAPYLGPDTKPDHSFLHIPKFLKSFDSFELAIVNILLKFVKIWMIIKGTSGSNFHIFTQAGRDGVYICNYTFCHYKTFNNKARYKTLTMIIAATTIVSLIVALVFPGKPIGHAATYNWTQSLWNTLTANYANHASNQSGWAEYSAKDAGISAGATVGLGAAAGSYEETLDADFNDTNLASGWGMDEGSGSYINDSSGNGNVGALTASGVSLVDSADSTTGWSPINGSLSTTTSPIKEGSAALNLIKTVTDQTDIIYEKAISSTNMQNKWINVWLYIASTASRDKMGGSPMILIGSSSYSWYIAKIFNTISLQTGWNLISFNTASPDSTYGTPDLTSVSKIRIDTDAATNSTTYAAGEIIMDDWFLSDSNTLAPTWTASGKYGNALSFDGTDDYLTVPDSNSLDITTAFTFSSWIYLTKSSWPLNEEWATIFTKDNPWGAYWFSIFNDGAIQTFFNGGANQFRSTGAISINAWQHVAVTYDGVTIRNYINGALSGETGWVGSVSANTQNLMFGTTSGNQYHFAGSIDEVRIYSTALTQAQIQAVMENAKSKGDTYVSSGSVKLIIPPAQVTSLAANSGNAQAVLTWTAPTDNGGAIGGYKVYRGTTSGGETLLEAGGCSGLGNVLTCTDAGLTNGTTYYYKITAVNAIGESGQSSEVNATAGYISGICSGIAVYYTDIVGTKTWGPTSGCVAPYVSGPCGVEDSYLVDPAIYPDVDFTTYPAQNACKAIGARLPSKTQLACIYTNRASFGTFQSEYYWSSVPYYQGSSAWGHHLSTNGVTMGAGTNPWRVRCVK